MECTGQCSFTTYQISTMSTKIPSQESVKLRRYHKKWLEDLSANYWKKNAIEVSISMKSLISTRIEVSPKFSFIDTISAFGGLGGFLIGASLVTVIELAFFFRDMASVFANALAKFFKSEQQNCCVPKKRKYGNT